MNWFGFLWGNNKACYCPSPLSEKYYKGVLCNLGTYRIMGENKTALYYVDSPDQETMLKAGFVDVQPCLWGKILTDEEYNEITHIFD